MRDTDDAPSRNAVRILQETMAEHYKAVRHLDEFESLVTCELSSLSNYLVGCDTRTQCILVVSFLEDAIKRNIIRYWGIDKASSQNAYFGSNGPLSTFSQRVLIAQALTWISADDAADASLLRKIRNEFAHSHSVHSLLQPPLIDWAKALKAWEESWIPITEYSRVLEAADEETRPRLRVFCSATVLAARLFGRSKLEQNGLRGLRRPKGYQELTEIEQAIMDVTIKHCWKLLSVDDEPLA